MNHKQKKLILTQKGKIAIGLAIALSIIGFFAVMSYFVGDNTESEIPASAVYSYSINNMVSESAIKEQEARELLRTEIESADKLIEDSEGKVFDSSRANLEIYLQNIRNIPDSQIVESNNIQDYANSEKRIRGFIVALSAKKDALQESYDQWGEERENLTNDQKTLQEEINSNSGSNTELEELLKEKQEAGNTAENDRTQRLEELLEERRTVVPKQPTQPSNPPVEQPTKSPEPNTPPPSKTPEPTNKPTPTPTPTPKPTTTPSSPTPTPTPSSDPEKPEPEETSAPNQDERD